MTEFRKFQKITRDNPYEVTITEKMDGTNGCIIIEDGVIVGVQSRNRLITIDDDNYGFAQWVSDNSTEILKLGNGYHYGEWCGEGIMKNRHKLEGKRFFLFNTERWNDNRPECCNVVPTLWPEERGKSRHKLQGDIIKKEMDRLMSYRSSWCVGDRGYEPEGIIIYWHTFNQYTKHTYAPTTGKALEAHRQMWYGKRSND